MKAFVTKYALTSGIKEVEGCTFGSSGFAYDGKGYTAHVHGKGWHRSKDAAVKQAEEMRIKKIASHKKAIAKLEKLSFR